MIYIQALAKGGCSTQGKSSYDARADVVVVSAHDGEIVNVTASFPDAISTVNYDTDGIETSEPTLSDASMTFELSNFNAGDIIRYDVMLTTGEVRQLRIEIGGASARLRSGGGDYGTFIS